MKRTISLTGPAVLAVLLCSAALGNDIGRWRMPSTVAQASAFGYGPGHHAPIVRAPGYRTPPAPRIVLAPPGQPPFCPQAYREIGGCGAGSCSAGYGAASHCSICSGSQSAYVPGPYLGGPEEFLPHAAAAGQSGRPYAAAPQTAAPQPTPAPQPRPQTQPPAARPAPAAEPLPSPTDRQAMFFGW